MAPGPVRGGGFASGLAVLLLLAACSTGGTDGGAAAGDGPVSTPGPTAGSPSRTESPIESPIESPGTSPTPTDAATSTRTPSERVDAADFERGIAVDAVRHLAGRIGPRPGTSPAYQRAARWVRGQLHGLGYVVRRQHFDVPGGLSWGVPVAAGRSTNLVATLPGVRVDEPHLVVGAHLDTVPQAPGAEDNASGVGVLLAVAAAVAERRTRLPVVLVAFGAEEPRGETDADHHYGSRAFVASLRPAERRAVRGMVSLDRVGVGGVVPVGSAAGSGTDPHSRGVLAAARRAGVPTLPDINRSSDHWSFVRAGLPGTRLGSTPYAAYHSAGDVPAVIQPDQLERVGRIVLEWLR